MLRPVAEGVQVHVSEFGQSNAVGVQGAGGVLLIDPAVAGFATHPYWDHLLSQPSLGGAPPVR